MYCAVCQKHLSKCDCPDKEERVRKIAAHPNIMMARCGACGEPYPLCRCEPSA
jgi:hypothetical protein